MKPRAWAVCLAVAVGSFIPSRSGAGPVECLSSFGDEHITCPTGVDVEASQPPLVSFPDPQIADIEWCGPISVVCTPPSGSLFPFGTTPVSCTATDTGASNAPSGTCSFDVVATQVAPVPIDTRGLVVLGLALAGLGTLALRFRS